MNVYCFLSIAVPILLAYVVGALAGILALQDHFYPPPVIKDDKRGSTEKLGCQIVKHPVIRERPENVTISYQIEVEIPAIQGVPGQKYKETVFFVDGPIWLLRHNAVTSDEGHRTLAVDFERTLTNSTQQSPLKMEIRVETIDRTRTVFFKESEVDCPFHEHYDILLKGAPPSWFILVFVSFGIGIPSIVAVSYIICYSFICISSK